MLFGIHPADKDLNFFRKLNEELYEKFHPNYIYLRLEPNYRTHDKCIRVLNMHKEGSLFFFCHALEKSIRGCKIEHVASGRNFRNFNYGTLISPERNMTIFQGKKVFCLACYSKDLGPQAMAAGSKVYLGFGDIPFYIKENYKESKIESAVKNNLKEIIGRAIELSITYNWSFNKLSSFIELSIDKRRLDLLFDKSSGKKIRLEVSNVLSRIKNGLTMFGNGELTVVN